MNGIFDENLILGCFCDANYLFILQMIMVVGVCWNLFVYLLLLLFWIHQVVTCMKNNLPKGIYYFLIK